MISKKIYLIRHAQTDLNKSGIVQGSGVDTSINEKGRLQASLFFDKYRSTPFDKIYTSSLKRSMESVEDFINGGISHQALAGLNEINWGKSEGLPFNPENDAYYREILKRWRNGETNYPVNGGESPEDVQARQKIALKEILDHQNEETILICMHGRAMRIFLCLLLHYPLTLMDVFHHQNLCLYILNYTGKHFSIHTFNDTDHLNSMTQ